MDSTIVTPVTLDSNNKVTAADKSLKLTISVSTGLFKGSVLVPGSKKPLAIGGVILQKQINGSGFFLNGTQAGEVIFSVP